MEEVNMYVEKEKTKKKKQMKTDEFWLQFKHCFSSGQYFE